MSVSGSSLDQQWARVCGRLRDEVGEIAYGRWLKPLAVSELRGSELRIAVPTRFMRDWVQTHYADRIRALWSGENPSVQSIEIVVASQRAAANGAAAPVPGGGPAVPPAAAPAASPALSPAVAEDAGARSQVPEGMGGGSSSDLDPDAARGSSVLSIEDRDAFAHLDPRFTFENFVVGKPNELAHAAARRVAEAQAVTFNPLFLYGGVGLGKTHLMHAIAWAIRKRDPNRRVLYLSAEKFMYQFIRALRFKDTMAFKEQFRSVDVLMIDDVQFISGKDSTQEEFFHTFNALVDQNRQVIISADKSPSDLEGMEERLRSRLGWGLVADIHPTTYELRLGILQAKADGMNIQIPQKVMEFLAHKISSNVRELEGALNRIVAHAELVGRSITLESTQEVLHDLLRANDRRVTIDEIQKKVAEHYNIRLSDMSSARRARAVARPRQVAMYLAKQLTQRSLPEIGRKFGGRDHTTVMHAVKKVEELVLDDPGFAEDVELLRRMLEG
ncbi:chromosomal replication initiator protein DnaA [Arenibaculum pallidiluteum]|uniref:chromosomal replication initiator protein DnaA n=1 Tax=Arenibaculum pallidiluteum TaxID=2812559 RepID=UPI001A9715A4|nr:chromosomal replication initiator protein DnaA [Arenibaculum pallidiluteum]